MLVDKCQINNGIISFFPPPVLDEVKQGQVWGYFVSALREFGGADTWAGCAGIKEVLSLKSCSEKLGE